MATYVQPHTSWGTTAGTNLGDSNRFHTSSTIFNGVDFYETLNRKRFAGQMEFSGFYGIIRDQIKAELGYPIIKVELTDYQIYLAIDKAISKMDYHAPLWCNQFATFTTVNGVNLYKLPQFMINNFVYAVYKKNLLTIAQQADTLEMDFFIKYFQDNFLFNDMMISDLLIMQMHLETIRKILGRDGSFEIVNGEFLMITPTPRSGDGEEVIVQFRALDLEKLHPFYVGWIQRYALAYCKKNLGNIRKKFKSLPSPEGGAQLDGKEMYDEGVAELQLLNEELMSEIEEPPQPFTMF
jgi:hypothetical protein